MTDSIRLGRVSGIPVGLHWSLGVFAALVAANLAQYFFPQFAPGLAGPIYLFAGIAAAFLLAGSILAHELGHALVARRGGVGTDGITLWLLGGVARLTAQPRTPRHAFEIAVAGPLVSVALGAASGALALGAYLAGFPALVVALLGYLGAVNGLLAAFNMIPALPLDGGRALQAWKWSRGGDSDVATIEAAKVGRTIGFVLVGLGLLQLGSGFGNGLWTALIGLFVLTQARRERIRAEQMIALRRGRTADPFAILRQILLAQRPAPAPAQGVADAELIVIEPDSPRVREN